MSFDALQPGGQKIAIVGGGISGLAAAYLLSPLHKVTLYEAEPTLGGHARTIVAGRNRDQPVDTGFIVFNHVTYPHLTRMFHDLDVPVQHSNMSFGISVDNGRVEYALTSLKALLAQPGNLANPQFLKMVRDILRFNKSAEEMAKDDTITIGDLVRALDLGSWFQRYYLMPFCGAIWSTPPEQIQDFPARTLVRFFRNHALLGVWGQHQWWTVKGGSVEYVARLQKCLEARGCVLRPGVPVKSIQRDDTGVVVQTEKLPAENFDQVIMACHSDQALRLLAQPTAQEQSILSDMRYQDNQMVLHHDARQMPRRRVCWASWVCRSPGDPLTSPVSVSYWMNKLQSIPEDDPLFVTLNPLEPVREEMIYDMKTFRHPVFDSAALHAQARLKQVQGLNRTWFAGAYLRNGFHEDGFASAVRIAKLMARQFA